ncbi:hypothetical protein [Cellulomonas sp. S1-8]|uniref:hypothetical protein n=1 Tax=Cellulomonas sp. S1-8 TaxID=2904790 RepID=UPI002243AC26|nr:hypothetical protein [Cellulomonas sp. S1-8]UZN01933.1 hypothetical protein OKX07_12645 [Cellulomonas sp. S1-8]
MTTDIGTATEPEPTDGSVRRRFVRHPVVQALLVLVCATVVAAPFLADRIRDTPGISPQDELSYIDTLVRTQDGQLLMRQGATLAPETLQELGCRGVDQSALVPNAKVCAGAPSDIEFYNTADIDPPLYHWTVAALAHVPYGLGLTENMITAARLLGILWCALTMTLVFFLARHLGAPVGAAAAAGLAPLWLSITNIQFQYVTPHSTGALVGAVVAFVVALRLRDRVPWWVVSLAGLLAGTVKLTNLVVVMAGCAAFLVAWLWRTPDGAPRPRRRLLDILNLAGCALAVTLVWVVVRGLLRLNDDEPYEEALVDSLTPAQVLENVGVFMQPLSYGPSRGFAQLLAIAMFGGAVWVAASSSMPLYKRQLAAGLALAGALAPVALVLMNFVVTSYYVPTQGRYGLSLVPLGLALAASLVRPGQRWLQGTILGLSVVCLALAWYQTPSLLGS